MYSNRLTKSTIKIDIIKQINTDCSPFETIIYLPKRSNHLLIEKPNETRIFKIPGHKISEYIQINKVKTGWVKNIDGTYIKCNDRSIYHLLPLTNELTFYNLKFSHALDIKDYRRLRQITSENFKLEKNEKINNDRFMYKFNITVPIWPMWGIVYTHITKGPNENSVYHLDKIYMKVDDEFYRFPYGNVSSSDRVCIGRNNINNFKNIESVLINWISSIFNFDYSFNLKASNLYTANKGDLIPITYDLEYINLMISLRKTNKLSAIDLLFYLANIVDMNHVQMSNIFIKHPDIWKDNQL